MFFAAVMPASAAEMKFRRISSGVPLKRRSRRTQARNIPNCWMRLRHR